MDLGRGQEARLTEKFNSERGWWCQWAKAGPFLLHNEFLLSLVNRDVLNYYNFIVRPIRLGTLICAHTPQHCNGSSDGRFYDTVCVASNRQFHVYVFPTSIPCPNHRPPNIACGRVVRMQPWPMSWCQEWPWDPEEREASRSRTAWRPWFWVGPLSSS